MIVRSTPQFDTKTVHRMIGRLLSPDLKEFAENLMNGRTDVTRVTTTIAGKLAGVAVAWNQRTPYSEAELERVIPVQRGQKGFPRLPDEVVGEILQRRASGQSRRQIAQATHRPITSVNNVLKREGDPAPDHLKARERDIKERTIAKLKNQLAALDAAEAKHEDDERRRNAG